MQVKSHHLQQAAITGSLWALILSVESKSAIFAFESQTDPIAGFQFAAITLLGAVLAALGFTLVGQKKSDERARVRRGTIWVRLIACAFLMFPVFFFGSSVKLHNDQQAWDAYHGTPAYQADVAMAAQVNLTISDRTAADYEIAEAAARTVRPVNANLSPLDAEFWFALIKVVTIVGMILLGLAIICFDITPLGKTASFSNLWSHGGFMPFGILGVVMTLQIVMFAYQGVELIGVTAGEAQNPERVLPSATNSIIWRILAFYVGALVIMMALVPWSELRPGVSPFVFVFERIGIPGAAGLINFVVITAAASSCNSGIFSTGRMLYTLAQFRQAPRALGRVNRHHLPANAITLSTLVMSIGVVLNYLVPEQVFVWVTSISLIGALWTWTIIVLAHLGYRRAVAAGTVKAVSFRMPGAPYMNWVVVAFMVAVCGLLALDPSTRVALYVAPVWFALLGIGYRLCANGNGASVPTVVPVRLQPESKS